MPILEVGDLMNQKSLRKNCGGFGLIDLLAMLAAVLIVAALALPYLAKSRAKSSRTNCVNHMKQVGLTFRLWSGDNGDKSPMQVSTNLGGTMELIAGGSVYPHFAVMSNELATPKILICPDDPKRSAATNFASLRDANISYFIIPEADEMQAEMWVTGDRNLTTNQVPLKPGLHTVTSNSVPGWTTQIHPFGGNLGLADGSVQPLSSARLHQSFTNALRARYEATTNTTIRIIVP